MYSIIIPVYQVKEYIVECLESIFCQIPTDVQVILVDDGSTDGSGEICDEYARKYPQIEVIHQENRGVAAARNVGLAAAKGEYLLWVDPDDRVAKDWFREIDLAVDQEHPDFICFDSMRVTGKKKRKEVYGRKGRLVDKNVICEDVARDMRLLSGLPNKVMKRILFCGIMFDEELRILEDYSLIFSILERASVFYYIPKILYFYRQNAHSLLHSYSPERSFQCVRIAEQRRAALPEKYKQAALIGVAVQAFLFCRSVAYDSRFTEESEHFQYCKSFLHKHMLEICSDKEVSMKWKIKMVFMDRDVLIPAVRIIEMLKRGYSYDKL